MQKDVSLKERLVFRRNALNLTQAELAERSGLSERSISDYERGLSQPSLDQLRKLSKALAVRSAYLLGEEDIEADILSERSKTTDVVGYAHLESATLTKILSEMSSKLNTLPAHERKHVLGTLRAILDELEDRELLKKAVTEVEHPGVIYGRRKRSSSVQGAKQKLVDILEDHKKGSGPSKSSQ